MFQINMVGFQVHFKREHEQIIGILCTPSQTIDILGLNQNDSH